MLIKKQGDAIMPIYEYKCHACGREFETLVMGSTQPQCPDCSSHELSRLMSACGFVSRATGAAGESTVKRTAASSGCSGCSATNCASCGVG
jgi:putative FmdB family regulatory protein